MTEKSMMPCGALFDRNVWWCRMYSVTPGAFSAAMLVIRRPVTLRAAARRVTGRRMTSMAAEKAPGVTEYILHHQTFLSNKAPHGIIDFSVINYDTVFFSVLLDVVFFVLYSSC